MNMSTSFESEEENIVVTPECFQNYDGTPSCFGSIQFVGKARDQFAPYIQISAQTPNLELFPHFLFHYWELDRPHVLLSITGGAQDFKMKPRLEQVFSRGLVKAAQNTKAWIITGGLDTGVMDYVGRAVRMQDSKVPTIAISSFKMVTHFETLASYNQVVSYKKMMPNSGKSCALESNHTHFILVDDVTGWGKEIKFRSDLEDVITKSKNVPLVLIVVEGGPGTLETVLQGVKKGFPVIVVAGSGRAADAISVAWRLALKEKVADTTILEVPPFNSKPSRASLDQIVEMGMQYRNITLFDLQDEKTQDLDVFILRAILNDKQRAWSFEKKVMLVIEWNRADILADLFDSAEGTRQTADILLALDCALQKALELDRHSIIELLLKNGTKPTNVNLAYLYRHQRSGFEPWVSSSRKDDDDTPDDDLKLAKNLGDSRDLLNNNLRSSRPRMLWSDKPGVRTPSDEKFPSFIKKLLREWLPKSYVSNYSTGEVTFTDILIWAILLNRKDLGYTIWKRTNYPIHTALLCSGLYRRMASCVLDSQTLIESAQWFENLAIGVLDQFEDYSQAKSALRLPCPMLGNRDPMKMAASNECKTFISHTYCQMMLDEKWCSTQYGKIPARTSNFEAVKMILFPWFQNYQRSSEHQSESLWHFYEIPVCKMWTHTLFYFTFLSILSIVTISEKSMYSFSLLELIYFLWLGGLVIDEVNQFIKDPDDHFEDFWNKVDLSMYCFGVLFVGLRILAFIFGVEVFRDLACDALMFHMIICWLRLMNVFSINYSLGPLLVAIGKMMKDIGLFFVIFFLFFTSFSLGFTSLTRQVVSKTELFVGDEEQPRGDEWTTLYPQGTLGLPFWGLIGEFGDSFPLLSKTLFGIPLLGIYLILSNILLVNLLIAMMADTYSSIRDNSDKEWKFSRYFLVKEYGTSTLFPPPVNLLYLLARLVRICYTGQVIETFEKKGLSGIVEAIAGGEDDDDDEDEEADAGDVSSNEAREIVLKQIQQQRDNYLEKEGNDDAKALQTLIMSLKDKMETMSNHRVEDREFFESKFKTLEETLNKMMKVLPETFESKLDHIMRTASSSNIERHKMTLSTL